MMTGGPCAACGSNEGIQTKTLDGRWQCVDCRIKERAKQALSRRSECPVCRGKMKVVEDEFHLERRAKCHNCGLHIRVQEDGTVTKVIDPPAILCSSCGEPLQRNLQAFECRPCGRSVTA